MGCNPRFGERNATDSSICLSSHYSSQGTKSVKISSLKLHEMKLLSVGKGNFCLSAIVTRTFSPKCSIVTIILKHFGTIFTEFGLCQTSVFRLHLD